jgi:hypothetical protein
MRFRARRLLLTVLALALSPVCGQTVQPPIANHAPNRPMTRDLQSMTDAALDEAARQTKLDRARLKVISAEAVTWADGSLGCPQPGIGYTQALVPGYRIRVQAGAEVLDFHASRWGQLLLCPESRSAEPVSGNET